MFVLWIICALVVAAITAICALLGVFRKTPAFWLFSGAAVDVGLYLLVIGMPSY